MKHEARNGAPSNYYSDLGSQIVGADRVMTEASINIEKEKLNKYGKKNRTRFHFGAAHHPEGQGAVERLVQEMKKSFQICFFICFKYRKAYFVTVASLDV